VNHRYPQGGGDPGPENPAVRLFYFSWTYHIFPYIEQTSLHRLVPTQDLFVDINTVAGGTAALNKLDTSPVPIFYCPTRRSVQLYHGDAVTDYAGCSGSTGSDGIIIINNSPTYNVAQIAHVTDGLSNTLLLGERRINLNDMNTGNDCYDNEPAVRPANDCDVIRRAQASSGSWLTPQADSKAVVAINCGEFGGNGWCQFGSSHPEGMNAALADGSVRFIRFTVTPLNFKNLCVRSDGQVVNLNDL
jgi:prepilin-type processing-associated H-X9-DG protein